MPGLLHLCWYLAQRQPLIREKFDRQPCVEVWIVTFAARQRGVLVVLDEAVIRVPRKRQRVEPQRVYRWQLQQLQPRGCGLQDWQIEFDEIVAEDEFGTFGEGVKFRKRCDC